jgi:glycosyltransferase involved in cell wall biosynthesis
MNEVRNGLTEILFSFQTGGSERVGRDIAMHAASCGVPTTACSTHGGYGPISESLQASGIACEALQVGPGGRVGRAMRLFRHLQTHRTAVVHVQHFNMLSIVYGPARAAGVQRIVVTEHTDYFLRTDRKARRIARRYGSRSDAITVVHQGVADFLTVRLGLDEDSVKVIANGVDTQYYSPGPAGGLRAELGIPDSVCVIGNVGRLHPDKDPVNLVRALDLVPPAERERLHVLIVGDGECREEVERFIADHSLESRVILTGERHDILPLLRAMDVFALPSRTEGLPIAILEAMSCGLPIIATAVGGIAAAVGEGGIVVPPEDPAAFAHAIVRLSANDGLRETLGRHARRIALERFDVSAMFDAYAAALSSSAGLLNFQSNAPIRRMAN